MRGLVELQEDESGRGHGALSGGGLVACLQSSGAEYRGRARFAQEQAQETAVSAAIRAANSGTVISPSSPSAWERTATFSPSVSLSPTTSM